MLLLVVVLSLSLSVNSFPKTKMYVRKTRMEDQSSASSGYVYNSNSPTSYVNFLGHSGYDPLLINQNLPHIYPYYPKRLLSHLDTPSELQIGSNGDKVEIERGQEENNENYAVKGEKGEEGYKKKQEFDEQSQGHYNKEQDKGYYDKKGGEKKGEYEVEKHHGSENVEDSGVKGGSYSKSKGHKKGSKTTGYHKVLHKDEYKKDHTFYDESDKRGHFEKYGNGNSHHSSQNGASEKGGRTDVGFHENKQGQSGSYDNGSYDKNDKKHKAEEGENSYYDKAADYFKENGKQATQTFEFDDEK